MHGDASPGAQKIGERHLPHRPLHCEGIEVRRQLAAWIHEMNQVAKDVV